MKIYKTTIRMYSLIDGRDSTYTIYSDDLIDDDDCNYDENDGLTEYSHLSLSNANTEMMFKTSYWKDESKFLFKRTEVEVIHEKT